MTPEKDPQIQSLMDSGTQVVTIVGKSWDLHVKEILAVPFIRNLEMIEDSLKFLRSHFSRLIFDAEHFFDGYKRNPEYALQTLRSAEKAGTDLLVLCDTNGGTLPSEIAAIIHDVQKAVHTPLGIHAHNDSETAVANSLIAVESGVVHVQGTINGIGERCGNANLISIIPALSLKMNRYNCPPEKLRLLKHVSEFVDEMANRTPVKSQPYVGAAAFAHKGGLHTSAVVKNSIAYEHVNPKDRGQQPHFPNVETSRQGCIGAKGTGIWNFPSTG